MRRCFFSNFRESALHCGNINLQQKYKGRLKDE